MVHCCVLGCKSRSERNDENITFHSFSKDVNIRKQWIEATGRKSWEPTKYTRICSRHFEPHCFRKTQSLTYLYKNSTPTLHINSDPAPFTTVTVKVEIDDGHSDPAPSTSGVTVKEEQSDEDDLHTSCPSPQGLSYIGSEELDDALDSPTLINFRQQIKDLQSQLKQKDKTIKHLQETVAEKDRIIKAAEDTNNRILAKNKALKSILTKIKKKLVVAKNIKSSGDDSDGASMEVA